MFWMSKSSKVMVKKEAPKFQNLLLSFFCCFVGGVVNRGLLLLWRFCGVERRAWKADGEGGKRNAKHMCVRMLQQHPNPISHTQDPFQHHQGNHQKLCMLVYLWKDSQTTTNFIAPHDCRRKKKGLTRCWWWVLGAENVVYETRLEGSL